MSEGGNQKPALTLVAQPQDFFRELVTSALGRQRIAAQPATEFYLVNLLNQFITTDRLFPKDAQGVAREEPLALMIKEALEEPLPQAQRALFRQIGDVSLYVAGYFQESLNRKLVDLDYYIGLGGTAYRHVAARVDEESSRGLYAELADKFARFVDVLAEISDKTAPRSEKDLLRLYEVWVRTRSERAARALQEAGILPNDTVKKDWQ
jgi:hypothetical protein